MRLPAAPVLALVLLASLAQGALQDDPAAARLDRFRTYLERSPYHDKVFRGLVEGSRAAGLFEELLADYSARVLEDESSATARILLARLLGEDERFREAADHLRTVNPPTAEARRLMAHFQRRSGQTAQALETLEGALHLTREPELVRELQLERADLFLMQGNEDGARGAYRAVADLAAGDLDELVDVAALMADAGFPEDGVSLLEEARAQTEGDVPRTAQLLSTLGDLRERAKDGHGALAAYEEALPLLRQGHWLRKDLLTRSLDLHRRAGSLDEAITRFKVALAQNKGDLETRMALVTGLELARRSGEAIDELREATRLFPDDLVLSGRFAAALLAAGQKAERVRELQRALELAPADQRRRFDLGQALAERGDLEGADREWTRLIERAGSDPAQADRVARAWSQHGELERAQTVLQDTLSRDAGNVRRYGDLAQLLADQGRADAARQVLGQAERAMAGRARELDEVADLYRRHGDWRSTRRVFEAAQALDPTNPGRIGRLVQVSLELGDPDRTRELCTEWLELALDAGQRSAALEHYTSLIPRDQRAAEMQRLRQMIARDGGEQRAPSLLLAHFYRLENSAELAAKTLDAYLRQHPDDLAARARLARDLVKQGRVDWALTQYEDLMFRDPRRAPLYLMDQVLLLSKQHGRKAEVLERLERLRRLPPQDPGTWRDVAAAYRRLGDGGQAADCLEQALRLEPEDGPAHMALAKLFEEIGRRSEAAERYRLAWRHGDLDVRRGAIAGLHKLLDQTKDLQREMRELRQVSRRDPFDAETPRLLAALALRQEDYGEAVRLYGELVRREGDEPELLRRRAEAYVKLGRSGPALGDLRTLVELGEEVDGLITGIAKRYVSASEIGRTMDLGYLMSDPTPVAVQLDQAGRTRAAFDFLTRFERKTGELPAPALLTLAGLQEDLEDRRGALRTLERYGERHGGSWELSRRMGDLSHGLRDRRAALEHGQRMIEQGAPDRDIESYFDKKASREDLTRIRVRELLTLTDDAAAIEAGLAELSRNLYDTPQALDLLQKLRGRAARGDSIPAGYTAAAWSQRLEEWTLRLYHTNPRLVAPRLEVLERRRFALSSDEWVELLWLHHFIPKKDRPDLFGNRPGVRVVGGQPEGPGERAVERFPLSPKVLAAAGRWARLEGDLGHAVTWGRALCALLDEPEEREREASLRAQALERYAAEILLDSFAHPELTPGSPTSLRLARLTYSPASASTGLVMVPDRGHAGLLLAQDLFGLGRIAEARAALAALPELHPEALLERLQQARVHFELGQVGAGLAQTLDALRLRVQLAEEEPFDLLLEWQSTLDQELARLTAAFVRTGLRRWVS